MKNSKTLRLIESYRRQLNEQGEGPPEEAPIDATSGAAADAPPAEPTEPVPMTSEGEKYLIDLLVKAFAHSPDESELKIIDNINQQYRNSNPKEIAETIQKLLAGGEEDFADTLNLA